MSVSLAFEAQRPRDLILIRTHIIPMPVLEAKTARNKRTQSCFGRMPQLPTDMTTTRAILQHTVQLESQILDRAGMRQVAVELAQLASNRRHLEPLPGLAAPRHRLADKAVTLDLVDPELYARIRDDLLDNVCF